MGCTPLGVVVVGLTTGAGADVGGVPPPAGDGLGTALGDGGAGVGVTAAGVGVAALGGGVMVLAGGVMIPAGRRADPLRGL